MACRPVGAKLFFLTSAGILLIWTLGINLSEILSAIHTFLFKVGRDMAATFSRPEYVI